MVAPSAFPITLYIDGIDVTTLVNFDTIDYEDSRTAIGSLRFTVSKPGFVPVRNMYVSMIANSVMTFFGLITGVKSHKHKNGIVMLYDIEAADQKYRLQNAVLGYKEYSDTDGNILDSLLADAYPDLSEFFDFDVSDLSSAIDFEVNDTSLLDALGSLADLLGADWSMGLTDGDGAINYFPNPRLMTADDNDRYIRGNLVGAITSPTLADPTSGGYSDSNKITDNYFLSGGGEPRFWVTLGQSEEDTGPNDNASLVITYAPDTWITVQGWFQTSIYDVGMQMQAGAIVWETDETDPAASIYSIQKGASPLNFSAANTWTRFHANFDIGDQLAGTIAGAQYKIAVYFYLRDIGKAGSASETVTFSNLMVEIRTQDSDPDTPTDWFSGNSTDAIWLGSANDSKSQLGGESPLNWGAAPSAPFDIDIQSGDEFASDIDLELGDFDSFNTVFVTGGIEEVTVDWTMESDGDLVTFPLPTFIKNYTISKNTNTDASPTWTAQTVGVWGVDTFTTKNVLYDTVEHWLYFNTAPSNLSKSIRIQATIERPIRVRVDDPSIDSDTPILATTINDDSITSVADANAIGEAALAKKNNPTRLSFNTYEPGLRAGQSITVTDSARGLNETLTIQRVTARWLGASGHAQFSVEAGTGESDGIDVIVANNDKRSRANSPRASLTTIISNALLDADNSVLTDSDGATLYEVS